MNKYEQDVCTISLATLRAIGADAKLQFVRGVRPSQPDPDTFYLSTNLDLSTQARRAKFRADRDSFALRKRYSNPEYFEHFLPEGNLSKEIYDVLEQSRCEALGARQLQGVAIDLQDRLNTSAEQFCKTEGSLLRTQNVLYAMMLVSRGSMLQMDLNQNAIEYLAASYPDAVENLLEIMPELLHQLANQLEFDRLAGEIANGFGAKDKTSDSLDKKAADDSGKESSDMTEKSNSEQHNALATTHERMSYKQLMALWQAATPVYASSDDGDTRSFNYRVFTREYDEILHAKNFHHSHLAASWRKQLDAQLKLLPIGVIRAANRLRRFLLAQQRSDWQFDLEEGQLDSRKLAQLVACPTNVEIFKQQKNTRYQDTLVSLLIDNSGSMSGEPILTAALSAEFIGKLLEHCQIKTELLGFTTNNVKGANLKREWVRAAKPFNPGRLNALKHIIYKSAGENWKSARKTIPYMLDSGLLKENIDGEALEWASNRAMQYPFKRRILMVISDGAPVDDATAQANQKGYLEKHLRQVIKRLEKSADIELLAIGIGHDVTDYYANSVTLENSKGLTEALLKELFTMLKNSQKICSGSLSQNSL